MRYLISILETALRTNNFKSLKYLLDPLFYWRVLFEKNQSLKYKAYWSEIFFNHIYHFETDNPKPFIIDCGANRGFAIDYFLMLYPYAHILAFEPNRNNRRFLNAREAEVIYCAVGAENKTLWVQERQEPNEGFNLDVSGSYAVDVVRLSDYLHKGVMVDCLKLDIEGCEDEVIKNLVETGKIKQIKIIVMEYHAHLCGCSFTALISMLEDTHNVEFVQPSTHENGHYYNMRATLLR